MAVEPHGTNRKENICKNVKPPCRRPAVQEVSPSMRLQGLTDALPLGPAFFLCGCHGPALHAAPPAPGGQTQRQPATHLSALPHQALMPPRMSMLSSSPISCFLPSPHWAVSLSPLPGLHSSRPSLSLAPVPAAPDERYWQRLPRDRKGPRDCVPCLPKGLALHSLLHLQGWSGRAPIPSPQEWLCPPCY